MDSPAKEEYADEVTLRPFALGDVDTFMVWASDDRVMRSSRRPTCASRDDTLALIRDIILPHPWYRAICVGGRPVGSVCVTPAAGADGAHQASVGYGLAHEHWRRGIATAAVRKAAAAVFGEWPRLERLEAVAKVGNRASQRVLENTGFRREAALRRYVVVRWESCDVACTVCCLLILEFFSDHFFAVQLCQRTSTLLMFS